MRSILLFKELLGLVEMTSGLVNVSFSLPEWQAVKMISFAPCLIVFLCENELFQTGWGVFVNCHTCGNSGGVGGPSVPCKNGKSMEVGGGS